MKHTFIFPEMSIGDDHFAQVRVEVHGDAPDFLEVVSVQLFNDNMQPVTLSETQFVTLFPQGQDIVNNAFEEAAQ